MTWCEETDTLDCVVGIAKNTRLLSAIQQELNQVRERAEAADAPVRQFKDLRYRTLNTWSGERRGVAKVEHIPGKSTPRFIVTSLSIDKVDARELYEDVYCARGDMENRIKEQPLGLFGDRASGHDMGTHQMRL